jgi:hypothetical protein
MALDTPQTDLIDRRDPPEPSEVVEFLPDEPVTFRPSPGVWRLSLLLFVLTCGSTFFIGAVSYGGLPLRVLLAHLVNQTPEAAMLLRHFVRSGLMYAGPLMAILLTHELGHFLQAQRYRVPAIPPLFIPLPLPPFGTMGAVIVQSPHHADRKAMFDIAISGPLAGLAVALPIAWLGILHSETAVLDPSKTVQVFGDPLLLKWMIRAVHGPLAPNEDVIINPLLMAGWVGIFITALNLTPIGQLDGGHILYCLIGKRAHLVAKLLIGVVIAYMFLANYFAYSLMVVLLLVMGVNHPPTTNDRAPLGVGRYILGWLTLAFLLIGINPRPLDTLSPQQGVPVPPAALEVAPTP